MSAALTTNVDQKLLRTTKFPPEYEVGVDMSKVQVTVIKKWVADEVERILKNEDEIVTEMIFEILDTKHSPDIKSLQISLGGFLDKDAAPFCLELWKMCISAQANPQGIPQQLLDAKKAELVSRGSSEGHVRPMLIMSSVKRHRPARLAWPVAVRKKSWRLNASLSASVSVSVVLAQQTEVEEGREDATRIAVHRLVTIRDRHQDDVSVTVTATIERLARPTATFHPVADAETTVHHHHHLAAIATGRCLAADRALHHVAAADPHPPIASLAPNHALHHTDATVSAPGHHVVDLAAGKEEPDPAPSITDPAHVLPGATTIAHAPAAHLASATARRRAPFHRHRRRSDRPSRPTTSSPSTTVRWRLTSIGSAGSHRKSRKQTEKPSMRYDQ